MCGIAGYVGKGSQSDLQAMVAALKHRGPDYQACDVRNEVGLGHARLSILDLSAAANQPFYNADKSIAIVFNGEIYNYPALKKELSQSGKYTFRTNSDTEVLLCLYEEYGESLFEKINGMFAFAIYDFRKKTLLLARDRMGKKPLYYGVLDGTLIFASELKALTHHPVFKKEINLNALNEYLTFDYVPTISSIYKDIYKLEPASFLLFKEGKIISRRKYWEVSFKPSTIGYEEAGAKLDTLLDQAVSSRLISDVPLGVFLSGGLDSSTIAYYAQKNSDSKIKTFSIGFENKSYDESDYAQKVALHLGTEHHTKILDPKKTLSLIPFIFENIDEPFADASVIPTYFLSEFTRAQVTVALGGDGSDELLAGYPTFLSDYFIKGYASLPSFLKKTAASGAGLLPVSDKNISFDFKVQQFLKGFEKDSRYTHTLWLGSFSPSEKKQLLHPDTLRAISNGDGFESIDTCYREMANESTFNQLLYAYYKTYLLDDILFKVDRASMLASLEVRAPFLDYKLVEFVSSLPESYKRKGFSGKRLLKDMMAGKIPSEIIDRPKKGFGIPLSIWLRTELKALCLDLLSEASLGKHGLFNQGYVEKLKEEHFNKKRNHRKLLWNLMVFQGWYNSNF